MTNNELSRKVLAELKARSGTARFKELVQSLGVDARAVFKNLFFLEERGLVQLSTSTPMDAVYPQIHLVRLRPAGEELLADPARMEAIFPLSDDTTDTHLHIPPELNTNQVPTFEQVLELLATRVRQTMSGEERDNLLEKIESLLGLPFIHEPIK